MLTVLCILSCGFINEELPAEIQKFAKKQQVLNRAKYSNLPYTLLAKAIFFTLNFFVLENYFLNFLDMQIKNRSLS
jgi:hypothetical protein